MNRPLKDHEQAALEPLIGRRAALDQKIAELQEHRADVQVGIDAVLAMVFGRRVANVQATTVDGRMVLVAPDPVALVDEGTEAGGTENQTPEAESA